MNNWPSKFYYSLDLFNSNADGMSVFESHEHEHDHENICIKWSTFLIISS